MKKTIIPILISTTILSVMLTGCFDRSSNSTATPPSSSIAYHYDCNFTEPFLTLKFIPATSTVVKMGPDPQTGAVVTQNFLSAQGTFTNTSGHTIIVATPLDLNVASLYIIDDGTPGSDGMSDTSYTYHGKTSYVVPETPLTATIIYGGCNKVNSPVVEAESDAASS